MSTQQYTQTKKELMMHLEAERLKSFENWPFDESCRCTPAKLAKAGFYSCATENEPDAVQCFMCFKELDGWEPDDDPWQEHKNHSPSCPFLQLTQPLESMTCEQVLKLEMTRNKNKSKKILDKTLNEFMDTVSGVRDEMKKLAG
ncbi:baculoviral IAP repeat-containing protein 5-like [Mytilus californianus]|uniref:baculoviral IAP repeat-containing protein 5-like n=1 Tax=Mytilus californianus TaxID=6549 RepID=UPI002245C4B3|nr:baculoviral IAP repeat-containing protein 5-like [Mytilus californianus]